MRNKLKLLITLIMCATLATCHWVWMEPEPYPPCRAIYYAMNDEPRHFLASNRPNLCESQSRNNSTVPMTYIHQVFNPDPVDVFSRGKRVGSPKADGVLTAFLYRIYSRGFEGYKGFAPVLPEVDCHDYREGNKLRLIAWGTNETKVANVKCRPMVKPQWVCGGGKRRKKK